MFRLLLIFKPGIRRQLSFLVGRKFFFDFAQFNDFCWLDLSDVAADVELFLFRTVLTRNLPVEWICGHQASGVARLQLENYSVHSVHRSVLFASLKELFAANCAGYYITHQRVTLRQVSGEIHFFPFIPLFYAETGKSEIRADSVGTYKVHLAI